jgi:voltage-gated potassium channel
VARRSFSWARPGLIFVGLLASYYAFPVELAGKSAAGTITSLVIALAGLTLVASVMVKELRAVRRGDPGRGVRIVAMMLVLLVMGASLAFFLLNNARPDEFSGMSTKTDALYFTLATMSTVGFGDVHAEGQLARALVCILIVFNIVVGASLARIYTTHRESL